MQKNSNVPHNKRDAMRACNGANASAYSLKMQSQHAQVQARNGKASVRVHKSSALQKIRNHASLVELRSKK